MRQVNIKCADDKVQKIQHVTRVMLMGRTQPSSCVVHSRTGIEKNVC